MFIVRTTEDDIVEVVCEICGESVSEKLEPPFDEIESFNWKWANIGPMIMQHHRLKHSSKSLEVCPNCNVPFLTPHWRAYDLVTRSWVPSSAWEEEVGYWRCDWRCEKC